MICTDNRPALCLSFSRPLITAAARFLQSKQTRRNFWLSARITLPLSLSRRSLISQILARCYIPERAISRGTSFLRLFSLAPPGWKFLPHRGLTETGSEEREEEREKRLLGQIFEARGIRSLIGSRKEERRRGRESRSVG